MYILYKLIHRGNVFDAKHQDKQQLVKLFIINEIVQGTCPLVCMRYPTITYAEIVACLENISRLK